MFWIRVLWKKINRKIKIPRQSARYFIYRSLVRQSLENLSKLCGHPESGVLLGLRGGRRRRGRLLGRGCHEALAGVGGDGDRVTVVVQADNRRPLRRGPDRLLVGRSDSHNHHCDGHDDHCRDHCQAGQGQVVSSFLPASLSGRTKCGKTEKCH